MKKVMILAAIAAMFVGSAFAVCGDVPVEDTAWVYKWTFTGKTTTAKTLAAPVASACGDAGGFECAVRVPTSLKIQGYSYMCSPDCGTTTFAGFSEDNEVFWAKKPSKASLAGGVTTEVCNIIGLKKNKCEIQGIADMTEFMGETNGSIYNFTLAGFGKYDAKHSRITSASGTFAGTLSQPHAKNEWCVTGGFWNCADLSLNCEGPSIVTGKWKVKLQKSASKKYAKGGKFASLPSWVETKND